MKKNLLLLSVLLGISILASAQNVFFNDLDESRIALNNNRRVIFPVQYRTLQIDFRGIRNFLRQLPSEHNILNRNLAPVLDLPMPDGSTAKFRVWESSIQEPGLQDKFPEIRTYAGQGIDDPYATIRFDFNPYDGFHAQVLSPAKGRVYIDPYARGDIDHYMSYSQKDNHRNPFFTCEGPETFDIQNRSAAVALATGACRGTQLYTYRLAVACTGEYAVAVGGTTAALLHSKIVTTVNRVDGVYESEVAVRLVLIATNNLVEFLDAATDPFNGNNNASTLITESQTQITNRIGAANFDIGHTFSTGGGGLAGLGVVCTAGQKARGITGSSNPVGDGYDIDYVAHEVGHQFGGNHTFNSITGSCSGNGNSGTAYEVGSGTTIQAYAGICGTDNIQPNSDPYFHTVSFDEISTYIEAGGASCRVSTSTGNTLPVITAMNNNGASIPLNTPFTLTGAATDADNDGLTYNWEEWDLGSFGAWNAGAASTTAPLFKSRVPKTSGSRTFPDMAVILAGYPASPTATMGGLKGETLPTVARAMKFRLTVRDNRAGGAGVVTGGNGCNTGFTGTYQVNTIAGTGPFIVTLPNGGESYVGNTAQTITWNVAGTAASPISVSNVKISLSTDGGLTYPTVITASTANDGSESLTIPNLPTATARIKIEAVGNIFFDISNSNFTITESAPGFDFVSPVTGFVGCNGAATAGIQLNSVSYFGHTTPINLSASGLPAGTSIVFATNPLTPGNSTAMAINNVNTLAAGDYTFTVTGVSGSITKIQLVTLTVQAGAAPVITQQPVAAVACDGSNASFSVTATGSIINYQWQVSTNNGSTFSNISGANAATYTINAVTSSQSLNQFRVIINGTCNTTTSQSRTLTVNSAPTAPVATPTSATDCVGNIVTLHAEAKRIQTGTIGTGTATTTGNTSASTLGPNPLQNYYGGSKQQILFTSTELSTMGMVNGSAISAISFDLVTADPSWTLLNLVVKMKNSTTTALSAWETGLTTVRTAGNFVPAVGSNKITLTTPFTWNGTQNLVIEVNYSNNNAGTTGTIFNTARYSTTSFVSSRFYRVDNASATTVDAFVGTPSNTYSQRNNIAFDYTVNNPITWTPTTGLYTDALATDPYTGTSAETVYAKPATGGIYNFTASSAIASCSKSTIVPVTINSCGSTVLNLKLFLQGYYAGDGTMQPVLLNQAAGSSATETDNITVEIHDAVDPSIIRATTTVMLNTNGTATANIPASVTGSNYIAIKHRNSIQTWTANPVTMTGTVNYDFTTAASKAYGNNQVNVGSSVWAFYSGDMNQDEFIDPFDFSNYNDDVLAGVNGVYNANDMNGDGFVDPFDFSQYNDNVLAGISAVHP